MPTNCTIAVDKETRERLSKLKLVEGDTYNAVINRLIKVANPKEIPKSQKRL